MMTGVPRNWVLVWCGIRPHVHRRNCGRCEFSSTNWIFRDDKIITAVSIYARLSYILLWVAYELCLKFRNVSLCWLSLIVQGWVFLTQSTLTKLTRWCIFLLISRFWLSQIPERYMNFLLIIQRIVILVLVQWVFLIVQSARLISHCVGIEIDAHQYKHYFF